MLPISHRSTGPAPKRSSTPWRSCPREPLMPGHVTDGRHGRSFTTSLTRRPIPISDCGGWLPMLRPCRSRGTTKKPGQHIQLLDTPLVISTVRWPCSAQFARPRLSSLPDCSQMTYSAMACIRSPVPMTYMPG